MSLRLSFCFAATLLAAAPPEMEARLHHLQRTVTADGMTKVVTFQERFVRGQDRVWLERVLPEGKEGHDHGHEEAGHDHEGHDHDHEGGGAHAHLHPKDLGVSAQYVVKEGESLRLRFVHRGARTIIQAETRDYPEVGFDGSWATAFHLLDPARLKGMKPLARKAPAGARWFEKAEGTQTLRVLWSTRLEVPLRMEVASADGRRFQSTELRPLPRPGSRPWLALEGYRTREYTDLLD